MGSGCGTVASDTRDLRFDSSHWQILFNINCSTETMLKRPKRRKKRPGMGQFLKQLILILKYEPHFYYAAVASEVAGKVLLEHQKNVGSISKLLLECVLLPNHC